MGEESGSKTDLQLDTSEEIDEEIFEDDWSSSQSEEDLEAKGKVQDTAVGALSSDTAALSLKGTNAAGEPETVVDFLRGFLSQMGMTHTLDCFQAEWHEMVQRGQIDANGPDVMPGVYIQNRNLETEVKNAKKEMDEYKQAISNAEEAVVKIQKARDFHWLRHKRMLQEKNKLIEDIRKLTHECSDYLPKIKRMDEKYKKLVQQTVNAAVERDNTSLQSKHYWKNPQLDSASCVKGDK